MHDRDAKVTKAFVAKLKEHVVRHNASPNASPNMNGRCEQYVGTIRWERLVKFIISGKRHLDSVCEEFTRSYNEKRGANGVRSVVYHRSLKFLRKWRRRSPVKSVFESVSVGW